jgi:hypothetical protein
MFMYMTESKHRQGDLRQVKPSFPLRFSSLSLSLSLSACPKSGSLAHFAALTSLALLVTVGSLVSPLHLDDVHAATIDYTGGYRQVEYLTFTGSQYIDMGVDAVGNTKVTADYQYTALNSWSPVFGSRSGDSSARQSMAFAVDGGVDGYAYWRGNSASFGYNENLFTSAFNTSRHTVVANNATITVDSLASVTVTTGAPTVSYNLYLGATNENGTVVYYLKGRIYSAQIDKDDPASDRNFIPTRCNLATCDNVAGGGTASFGEYGMYDTLNNLFYRNGGSAEPLSGGKAIGQDAPTITSITLDTGSVFGGDTVVITGTEFGGASVEFDGTHAVCAVNDSTKITCATPAHSAVGAVDVSVVADGGTAVATDGFTYEEPSFAHQHYFAANQTGQTMDVDLSPFKKVYGFFREVEYLDFTGTQYINTAIDAVGNTKVTADYQYTTLSSWSPVFGSRSGDSSARQSMAFTVDGGVDGYAYWRGNSASFGYNENLFTSAFNTGRHTVVANNATVKVDSLATVTVSTGSPTVSYNMYLGAINEAGTVVYYFKGRIYSVQIDKDGTANDRNFVPVRCDSNPTCAGATNNWAAASYNEFGLYDTLNDVFYHAGAGVLGGGADVGASVTSVKIDGVSTGFAMTGSQLTVNVPSHAVTSASVPVEIVTTSGTVTLSGADGLNFVEITSPSPAVGSAGDVVTFSGSSFSAYTASAVNITFAGASGSDITIVNDNTITVKVPTNPVPGSFGAVDVVLTLGSESLTFANAWEYQAFIEISVDKPNLTMSGLPNELITDNLTVNVKTDNPTGYNLTIEASDTNLTCQTDNTKKITALSSTASPMQDNKWGYAVDNEVTPTTPSSWTGLTTTAASLKTTTTPQTNPTIGEDTRVWFGTRADYTLPACSYTGSVTFTAIAW